MQHRLTDKPHGDVSGCTLTITGTLPKYFSGVAYEGRLNVSGARGSVMLTSWTGELPPGAQVSFDSAAQQIVVNWPDYDAGVDDLDNLNFEAGDDGSWDKGAGWTIMQGVTAPDPNDPGSLWQAQFANQGGESEIMSRRAIKAVPGKAYTASVDVQQGASSKNHAGAAVRLRFFDASGNVTLVGDGNVVKSGSNSEWSGSSVTVVAPADAATVKLGAAAFRNHENASLWVDRFVWNGAYASASLGTNGSASYPVTFTVRDSHGCRSTWEGTVTGIAVETVADLDFEAGDFTDKTGRVWTVQSGTITDRWGSQPVTEPSVVANPAGNGLVFSKCPDTDNHDGTFDYFGHENLGLVAALGDSAFGTDADFWIDMDVRLNEHSAENNESVSFLCINSSGGRTTFGARVQSTASMENTVRDPNLHSESSAVVTVTPGQWFHFSLKREGDTLTCSVDGVAYAVYSGASAVNVRATDNIVLGHGDGGIASTLGWPGQIDNVKILREDAQ